MSTKYYYLSSSNVHIPVTEKAYDTAVRVSTGLFYKISCIDHKTEEKLVFFSSEPLEENAVKLVKEHFEVFQKNFEVEIISVSSLES